MYLFTCVFVLSEFGLKSQRFKQKMKNDMKTFAVNFKWSTCNSTDDWKEVKLNVSSVWGERVVHEETQNLTHLQI